MKTLVKKSQHDLITIQEKEASKPLKLINEEFLIDKNTVSICRITTKNTIKFCNTDFIKNSGYSEKELLQNSLDLIKHPEMPKIISDFTKYYIEKGMEIGVIVKNKTKNGKYFWSLNNYTPNKTKNLNIAYSIKHNAISFKTKTEINKLYNCLHSIENNSGEKTAYKYLIGYLEERQISFIDYTKQLASLS